VVYVASIGDTIYAFNASTGQQLWSATTGGSIYSSPAVVNGIVYVGSDDGSLYAFGLPRAAEPVRPDPAALKPNLTLTLECR